MPEVPAIRQMPRERLFRILKDPDLVKLFEDLLYAVGTALPSDASGVQANLDAHIADTTGAHAASAISSTATAAVPATNVQAAIALLSTMATQAANSVAITGGTVLLASGSLGYAAGNGGTVAQATSKSTGVTLNKVCGEITLNAAALAANTAASFVLTNSTIAAGDRIVVNHVSGGTFGAYCADGRCAAGSATIFLRNLTAGSLSEAVVLGFTVVKSATA
jgi:hypothetical protein